MADQPYDLVIVGAGMAGCTLAGKIAEQGVNPSTGEPLKIALFDRGPYFKGRSNPGYGHPIRRQMLPTSPTTFGESIWSEPGSRRERSARFL